MTKGLLSLFSRIIGARRRDQRSDGERVAAQSHANLSLARLATDRGEKGEAAKLFRRALEADPVNAEAWNELGLIFMDVGAREKAASCFTTALRYSPSMPQAMCNLGILSNEAGDSAEAEGWYRKALTHDKRHTPTLINLGLLRHEERADSEALRLLERALAIEPENSYARYTRGLIRLAHMDFASGWEDYEYRDRGQVAGSAHYPYPRWEGESLAGRTILIEAEQGIGDQIMFASCVRDLAKSARRCVLCCSVKLGKLFRRSFPEITVLDSKSVSNVARYEPIDYRVSIVSLGRYFRSAISDFPRHRGYLQVDTEDVDRWRARLDSASRLRIGISWRGGTPATRMDLRSVPLMDWAPMLQLDDLSFYSLQYTGCEKEVRETNDRLNAGIAHWPDAIHDFYETAALVASLDLIISVQTTVAHLAGSLGKPVWVLVPSRPEWRYGVKGDRLSWYPSARIFRQTPHGGWEQVVQRLAEILRGGTDRVT